MANPLPLPLPPPGQGTLLGPRHRSFQSYYGDTTLDPCQGRYDRIMSRFDVHENPGISHVMLFEQAVGAGILPQAYICCSATPQRATRIYCIHLPSKIFLALDGVPTQWDGQGFAFLGDVTQQVATTVSFPSNVFRATALNRAPTSDQFIMNLNNIGPSGVAAPVANDPDSELVATRQIMYLPAKYAALLMNPSGYTLKQTWEILYPAMVDNGDLVNCRPLLQWLQLASTGTTAPDEANGIGPSTLCLTLTAPLADTTLIHHRLQILKQALPALFKPEDSLETAIAQMAVAVTQNTNDTRVAREQRAAAVDAPKLPSDKFKNTINILLENLQVADEQNLPSVWHQWANCPKKQEFNILSELLHSYARGPDAFSPATPVVTAKLVQDLLSFVFHGDSPDDIKSGIQPFAIADGSAEHRHRNLEVARLYGLLQSGDQAVTLTDLEKLKAKEVLSIPLNYFELERNLGMFGNFLGVVLGNGHPLTTAYRSFWVRLTTGYRLDLQQIIDVKRDLYIQPAHILRSIQLICYNWFNQRRAGFQPDAPDFNYILQQLMLNTYIIPHLPLQIYQLIHPKPTLLSKLSPSPSLSGTTASSTTATSDTASVVSGITLPTFGGTQPPDGQSLQRDTKRKSSVIANLNPDRNLQRLLDFGTSLKELIGQDPPPTLDDGTPVCLSYFLRNSCWSTCSRAASHKTLTPTERAKLETYLKAQVAKLRAKP
jgi:hypothetical protein